MNNPVTDGKDFTKYMQNTSMGCLKSDEDRQENLKGHVYSAFIQKYLCYELG
jgi:hypothetical protein